MSDKNKNRKTRLADFFRYHRNELSGEERNSFERELQKDPFTEEASEGFHSILQDSAVEDISNLEKRLKSRTSGRKSFILYRIAASVAVLIAISSIFIIIEKNKSSKHLAVNSLQPPELEIARSKPITQSEIIEDRISAPAGSAARDRSLKKAVSSKEENISAYIPPQPVSGKLAFDRYIKENIHRPDSLTGQSAEVILSFLVQIDGSLDSIKIVSSPGKLYSDEAIRLIKSGPTWKPAELSGNPVEDRVKVKIGFR